MPSRVSSLVALCAAMLVATACADTTAPTHIAPSRAPVLSGGSATGGGSLGGGTTSAGGGSGTSSSTGGGGGSGGGGSSSASCGIIGHVTAGWVVVYTTRLGIGFDGTITNCGTNGTSYQMDVVDATTDPACTVQVPHFVAAHNAGAGSTIAFSATSTLVPCTGIMHYFVLTLRDANSGAALATTTSSAFR